MMSKTIDEASRAWQVGPGHVVDGSVLDAAGIGSTQGPETVARTAPCTIGGVPLLEALELRRSTREYSEQSQRPHVLRPRASIARATFAALRT
jgi:hypothetical protein